MNIDVISRLGDGRVDSVRMFRVMRVRGYEMKCMIIPPQTTLNEMPHHIKCAPPPDVLFSILGCMEGGDEPLPLGTPRTRMFR